MTNTKKNLISKLEEIRDSDSCFYDKQVEKIKELCNDYMNSTQDSSLDECLDEFIDDEVLEEIVKKELDNYGLDRLYFMLNGVDLIHYNLFKLNAYNNVENITKINVDCLVDDLIDRLQNY